VRIERLDTAVHDRSSFDCGEPSLDLFIRTLARQFQDRGLGVTWVAVDPADPRRILGYYTLSMSAVLQDEFSDSRLGVPRIPVALLGRMAVDRSVQGHGTGWRLLAHALYAAYHLSIRIGAHAVVVDPLNERAAAFYMKYGFEPMRGAPQRLYMTMKEVGLRLGPLRFVPDQADLGATQMGIATPQPHDG
jgi:GNAT superfamily N-acetyltransferase